MLFLELAYSRIFLFYRKLFPQSSTKLPAVFVLSVILTFSIYLFLNLAGYLSKLTELMKWSYDNLIYYGNAVVLLIFVFHLFIKNHNIDNDVEKLPLGRKKILVTLWWALLISAGIGLVKFYVTMFGSYHV